MCCEQYDKKNKERQTQFLMVYPLNRHKTRRRKEDEREDVYLFSFKASSDSSSSLT
jgi:hypothetical protein